MKSEQTMQGAQELTTSRRYREEYDCDDVEVCLSCTAHPVCYILYGYRTISEIKKCPCYTCLVNTVCQFDCKERKSYYNKLYNQDA